MTAMTDEGPIFDEDIAPARLRMLNSAQSSILMTSLTFPNKTLVDTLKKKAERGLEVALVVAYKTIRDKHSSWIDTLVDADVHVYGKDSTHSKLLVVDHEWVMIGSANAHGGHLDACHILRNKKYARDYANYIRKLMDMPIRAH